MRDIRNSISIKNNSILLCFIKGIFWRRYSKVFRRKGIRKFTRTFNLWSFALKEAEKTQLYTTFMDSIKLHKVKIIFEQRIKSPFRSFLLNRLLSFGGDKNLSTSIFRTNWEIPSGSTLWDEMPAKKKQQGRPFNLDCSKVAAIFSWVKESLEETPPKIFQRSLIW